MSANDERELSRLSSHIAAQNDKREVWTQNDSPHSVALHVLQEAKELVESIEDFDVTQDAEYQIVGEIGDVLYLTIRLCNMLGISPEEAVELKLARNSVKYPDHFSSNGWNYDQARDLSKSLWQSLGGDHAFFLWHALQYPLNDQSTDSSV